MSDNYLILIQGGEGPDVWDKEKQLSAVDFQDATTQATGLAEDLGGEVMLIEKSCPFERETIENLRNQLAEAQNKADDDWLNRIAIFWKGYTGKQWDVKDGEHREEGIASNLVVIFDEMHALEKERDQLKQQLENCKAKVVRIEDNWSATEIERNRFALEIITLNQKLAALTEALKPVREALKLYVKNIYDGDKAKQAISILDKLCAKGD